MQDDIKTEINKKIIWENGLKEIFVEYLASAAHADTYKEMNKILVSISMIC